MDEWLSIVTDARAIEAVYGENLPNLAGINVQEICFQQYGPEIIIRFDLAEFPADPPKKWLAKGFNTVQVQLSLSPARDILLENWKNRPIVDFSLTKDSNTVLAKIEDQGLRFIARADWAILASMSAYINTERIAPPPPLQN